jgi:uncharacterized membrane protein
MNAINQTGNQAFSFARYSALLKTYVTENGKTLALYTAVLIGISILVGAFIGNNLTTDTRISGDPRVGEIMMGAYIYAAFSFCLAISASFMFSSMQSRSSRISTLMLPASMAEKYLVRYTVYFILYIASFIIATLFGEAARLLASPSDTPCIFSEIGTLFSYLSQAKVTTFLVLYLIGAVLSNHSFYTLGSSLWPRHSFFKTFIASIALGMVMVIIIPSEQLILFSEAFKDRNWSILALIYIWAAVCYLLSWLRFRSTQIVQRFMMN